MALDNYQKKELNRLLENQKNWNMSGSLDLAYPKYQQIAEEVGCDVEDVKEYKDCFFKNGPTKNSIWG